MKKNTKIENNNFLKSFKSSIQAGVERFLEYKKFAIFKNNNQGGTMKNITQNIANSVFKRSKKLSECLLVVTIATVLHGASAHATDRVWSTYYGGYGNDQVFAMHTDGSRIIIGGVTNSDSQIIPPPGTASFSWQKDFGGNWDGFVAVFDANGRRLWSTYLGGWDYDEVVAVKIDSGSAFVAGNTNSPNFFSSQVYSQKDGFVMRFNPSTGQLIWGGRIGGNGDDQIWAMDTSLNGSVYVAGATFSTDIKANGLLKSNPSNWGSSGFIQQITSTGSLGNATYYGGAGTTQIHALRVNGNSIIIGGRTESSSGIASSGTLQSSYPGGGGAVGFVAQLDDSLQSRRWGTYLGTDNGESSVFAVEFDGGRIYAAGTTRSNKIPSGFTQTPQQGIYGGGYSDGFVAALTTTGSPSWWNFLGGNGDDTVFGLRVGNMTVYAAGITDSVNNISTNKPGGAGGDAFVVAYSSDGKRQWGSYFGGSDQDGARAVWTLGQDLIIAGHTRSRDGISAGTAGITPHQSTFGGGLDDGFVARVRSNGLDTTLKITGPAEHSMQVGERYEANNSPLRMRVVANGPAERWEIDPSTYQGEMAGWLDLAISKDGIITGSITRSGIARVHIIAYDKANRPSNIHTINITVVEGCPKLTISNKTSFNNDEFVEIQVSSDKPVSDWIIVPAQLPAGITFTKNEYAARISGYASSVSNYNFTHTITAKPRPGTGCNQDISVRVPLSITRRPSAPILKTIAPITHPVNRPLTTVVELDPAGGPVLSSGGWSIAGSPPTGMRPVEVSGGQGYRFEGTPTQTGFYNVFVTATGQGGTSNTITIQWTIEESEKKPCFTQASVPINGTVGEKISDEDLKKYLGNSGCTQPTSWRAGRSLPAGLTLNASGVITGTPSTTATNYEVDVFARNNAGEESIKVIFNISGPKAPCFTRDAEPINGTVGQAIATVDLKQYLDTVNCGPVTRWELESGNAWPSGISMNSQGVITGTPSVTFNRDVVVRAVNAVGSFSATATIRVPVNITGPKAPCFTGAVEPINGTVGQAIATVDLKQYLDTVNCGPVTRWELENGNAWPSGISMNSQGVITGTPSVTFNRDVVVRAVNAVGSFSATATIRVPVNITGPSAPCFTESEVPLNGTVGQAIATVDLKRYLRNGEGCGPVTRWELENGSTWPSGISMNGQGVITGTPSVTFNRDVVVRAVNAVGNFSGTATIRVQVNITGPKAPCFDRDEVVYNNWVVGESVGVIDLKQYLRKDGGCGQPVSWMIDNTGLVNGNPVVVPGVVMDRATGVISGIPTEVTYGEVERIVHAGNLGGKGYLRLKVTVKAGLEKPRFSKYDEWISKREKEEFSVDLNSYNVGGPIASWSWRGSLPSGVSFLNGVLSGKTDRVGRYSITATARNRVGEDTIVVNLDILRVFAKPVITGPAVINGQVGKEISVRPTVVGEINDIVGRLNWELTRESRDFPSGISMHPGTGLISGWPGIAGAGEGQEVTIRVEGPGGWSDPFTIVFNIRQAAPVIDADLKEVSGIAGRTLRHPKLSGGIIGGPLERWVAMGVDKVPGLSFDELTGVLSGVIERAGTYDITVVGVGPTGELSNELKIRYRIAERLENPRLVSPGDKVYNLGEEIEPFRIGNQGGPVETWSLLLGQESGVRIDSETGEISGKIWHAGVYTVEVLGSNAQGSGKVSFKITIRQPKPVITGPELITAKTGKDIDELVTVDPSKGVPGKWTSPDLPAGLRLNEYTYYAIHPVDGTMVLAVGARIQGKLATPGRRSFTLYADSIGRQGQIGDNSAAVQRSDAFRVEVNVVDEPHNEIEWDAYGFDVEEGLPAVHINGRVGQALPRADATDRYFVRNRAPEPSSVVSVRHTGNMPPGITYRAMDNGVVFLGTPTREGDYRAIIYGRNKDGKESAFVLTSKIWGLPKEIRFTNLPQTLKLKEGQEVNFAVGVTPADAQLRVVESDLPSYLNYDPQTRRLTGRVPLRTSGIPLRTWMPYFMNFRAEIEDGVSQPKDASLFIEIELDPQRDPKPPVPQPPTTLPVAYIGEPYQAIITAVPTPTNIEVLQPNNLPSGLTATMDNQGRLVISGTPDHLNFVQQTSFEVQGTNADGPGPKVIYNLRLERGRPFAPESPIISTGQRGVPYTFNLVGYHGGNLGWQHRIVGIDVNQPGHSVQLTPINGSPSLTALGLKLNTTQTPIGEISGTPTQSGTFRYRVTATNQRGANTQPIEFVLTIGEGAPLFDYPNGHTFTVYEDEPVALEILVESNPQSIQLNANLGQSGLVAAVQGNRITIGGVPQIVNGQNTLQLRATAQNPIGTTSATYTINIERGRPVISSISPINLTAGQSFTLGLSLQRGATPVTYTLTPIDGTPSLGQLGWTFTPNTGILNINTTNTPPGQYRFEASASNVRGTSLNTPEFTVFVNAQPVPIILPPYSFTFTEGNPISSAQINATNNPTLYTITPVGNAPSLAQLGISFNPVTGAFTGTPFIGTAQPQPYLYTVTATNAGGSGPASLLSILINAPTPPTILSPLQFMLSEGQPATGIQINATNNPTNFTLTPLGNTPPLSQLGLVFNPATGQINGTPFVGTGSSTPYEYQVTASNSAGSSAPATIQIFININTALLPVLQPPYTDTFYTNQPVTFTFTATNNPAYIQLINNLSTQAPGLTLQGNQFTLTGIPSQTGTYTYVIRARNTSNTQWGPNQTYTFTVINPPTVTGPATFTANVNQPINQPLTVSGNPQGYNLAVTPSNPGISVTGNTITGTPTTPGTYTVTITPLINNQPVGTPFTTTLTVRPVITAPGTISGTVGLPLSGGTMQTQGNPTLIAASSTPAPGITFSGGAFTGTPTTAGTYSYTVTGTANGVQSLPFPVTLQIVQPAPVLNPTNNYTFVIGQSVNQQIPVTNGPATFTASPAFNVPGLTLSPSGLITGTVGGSPNVYNYTIQANNGTPSNTANLTITVVQGATPTAVIQSATLRRNHGSVTYGLPLAIGGSIPTSDPRQGNQAVLRIQVPATFIPVTAANVQIIQGNATVGTVQTYGNNLIDVPITINGNNQRITIKINSINSTNITANNQLSFRVVRGDVNGNGVTNNLDISLINGSLNQPVTAANYTRDINQDGVINNADITAAQSNLGGSAP